MVDIYNRWTPDYPGQTPQQDPAYMTAVRRGMFPTINTAFQAAPAAASMSAPAQPQAVTPPTIHADMIQITDESEVDKFPVAAGAPRAFITRDETKIIFKTASPNGEPLPLDIYIKQPPAPPKPAFDPAAYVRRDEIQDMVDAAIKARIDAQTKKEAQA